MFHRTAGLVAFRRNWLKQIKKLDFWQKAGFCQKSSFIFIKSEFSIPKHRTHPWIDLDSSIGVILTLHP